MKGAIQVNRFAIHITAWSRRALKGLAALLLTVSTSAMAQTGLPGDVNLDGAINVLDVQGTINMALGVAEVAPEADIDENNNVDVLDVQNMTNSALGTGGLVQTVEGQFDVSLLPAGYSNVRCVAVSQDGRHASAPVDEDGFFQLGLQGKTSWTFAFFADGSESTDTVGTLAFPLAGGFSTALPLPNLSDGTSVDLGRVTPQIPGAVDVDVRTLVAGTAAPLNFSDGNGNSFPDLLEEWLLPLPLEIPDSIFELPASLVEDEFLQRLATCLDGELGAAQAPDLTGVENNGVPAFLQALVSCLAPELEAWLDSEINDPFLSSLIPTYVDYAEGVILEELDGWLDDLGRPELTDTNNNAVPDFLEPLLCSVSDFPNIGICDVDMDQNGLPDHAQDDDSDGIPNFYDTDRPDDSDGDGVPDLNDIDADGNGVPDYAE
jgi:hypothetical protein